MNSSESPNLEKTVRDHQEMLLEQTDRFLQGELLSEAIRDAFIATPRHQFAPLFPDGRPGLWSDIEESLLIQHLDNLYADQPYCIFRDDKDEVVSTISQPTLVIYMLHLLELEPGMNVFELGGGSGWNAAMMGRIVGNEGHVSSIEAETSLLENARRALKDKGLENVSLIAGDASLGLSDKGPFDRGIFTASSWDLPKVFFDQIKEDGLLLFVLKFSDEFDLLAVLRKHSQSFVSELHFPCRFVPVTGKNRIIPAQLPSPSEQAFHQWLDEKKLEPDDLDLSIHPIDKLANTHTSAHRFDRNECAYIWSKPQ